MRIPGVIILGMLCAPLAAQEVPVAGTVTYVAAGTVYTSLGRAQGLNDSTRLWILRGVDTITVLKVSALSSKSSACSVLTTREEVRVGARVVALVAKKAAAPDAVPPSAVIAGGGVTAGAPDSVRVRPASPKTRAAVELRGRVSAQLRTVDYDGEAQHLRQPAMVFNLQARSGLIPLALDLYANLRTSTYGTGGFFSRSAVNQSRVYRASLTYDDGSNLFAVGRTFVPLAWTLGPIDGAVVSKKWRGWTLGGAAGFQPEPGNRGVSTSARTVGIFASSDLGGNGRGYATAVYSRRYRQRALDRETVSGLTSVAFSPEFSFLGNAEVDLRRKRGDEFVLKPSLTTLYASVNYRAARALTIGLSGDASRPEFAFSEIRRLPDSLIERRLTWGASLQVTFSPLPGLILSNTFSPRSQASGRMRDYFDYASLTLSDLGSSGVTVRSDMNLSRSEYTNVFGVGGGLQKQFFQTIDASVRYHRSRYTIVRGGAQSISTTVGADLVVPVTPSLVFFSSYEWFDGYGTRSHSVMAEISVRF